MSVGGDPSLRLFAGLSAALGLAPDLQPALGMTHSRLWPGTATRPALALYSLLTIAPGCAQEQPLSCEISEERVLDLMPGHVCALSPSGLLLRREDASQSLVLERLSAAGTLEELARFTVAGSFRCGRVAQASSSASIWLTLPSGSDDEGDSLIELNARGERLSERTLHYWGAPQRVGGILAREDELYLAGAARLADLDGYPNWVATLERRDAAGSLQWREVGYAEADPSPWVPAQSFASFIKLVELDQKLGVFGANSGIDSTDLALLEVSMNTGLATASRPVGHFDAWESSAYLGSDGERELYVSEARRPVFRGGPASYGALGVLRPARSIVTASAGSRTQWRGEVEWPSIRRLRVSDPVAFEDSVFHVVWGYDVDEVERRHVGLARQDWTGSLDCRASLDHLGLFSGGSLTLLRDGRMVLVGERALNKDPEGAGGSNSIPVLAVFRAAPGPQVFDEVIQADR